MEDDLPKVFLRCCSHLNNPTAFLFEASSFFAFFNVPEALLKIPVSSKDIF